MSEEHLDPEIMMPSQGEEAEQSLAGKVLDFYNENHPVFILADKLAEEEDPVERESKVGEMLDFLEEKYPFFDLGIDVGVEPAELAKEYTKFIGQVVSFVEENRPPSGLLGPREVLEERQAFAKELINFIWENHPVKKFFELKYKKGRKVLQDEILQDKGQA
jgi:hypothetical protein